MIAKEPPPFANLLSPIQLGDLQLKNRVIMASLTRNRDGIPRDNLHVPYYAERASVGLIGTEWTYMTGIYLPEHVEGWKKVTLAVHEAGGLIFCQLHHAGPSDVAAGEGRFRNVPAAPGYVKPTPIEDPMEVMPLYDHASQCAKDAGFDGIEIHNANGFLPVQFLESHSNKGKDRWGGPIENKMQFSLTALRTMNKHFPYSRIGVKIAPCGGYNDMGEVDEDWNPSVEGAKATYGPFCAELDKLGPAYVQMMRWWASYDPMLGGKPRAVEWDPISYLRPILKNTPLVGNTAFTPGEAEEWIREGKMDAAMIGRPLIDNPDYVEKLKENRADEIDEEQPGDEFWRYKWRLNDKRDGYLNWQGRTKPPVLKGSGQDALSFIHDWLWSCPFETSSVSVLGIVLADQARTFP